jgi:hypothetical protein
MLNENKSEIEQLAKNIEGDLQTIQEGNFCQCGCGSEIADGKRYKHGHHRNGKRFPGQKGSPRPSLRGKPTWNKGKKWSADVRDKIRLAHVGKRDGPMSEERKRKISEAQKGIPRPYAHDNPQIFKKGNAPSDTSFKKGDEPWNKGKTGVYSEDWIDAMKKRRATLKIPFRDSTIEIAIQNELKKLDIEFTRKTFKIRNFFHEVDLFIEPNICIECDGENWHTMLVVGSNVLRIKRDYIIDYELEKMGMIVIRLWGYDINNNLAWCMKQILSGMDRKGFRSEKSTVYSY